jgi:hypothetical protein
MNKKIKRIEEDTKHASLIYMLHRIGTAKVSIKQLNEYLNGQGITVLQLWGKLNECIKSLTQAEDQFMEALEMFELGEEGPTFNLEMKEHE